LQLLREIGRLRIERETERNAVSISVPTQEVVPNESGYHLEYDVPVAAEHWNAQISLLTGMCAAELMVDAGVGILRTLPPANQQIVDRLRAAAKALGIPWPKDAGYDDVVRGLDPTPPAHAAFLTQAVHVLRGSGYEAIDPNEPIPLHSAVATPYAHVTAPLRRLVDRFGNEIVLALCAGASPPTWATDALADLPSAMGAAAQRASAVEHAVIDLVESVLLADRIGEMFDATVVNVDKDRANVLLRDPAVIAHIDGRGRELGEDVRLRVVAADPSTRRVEFEAQR
jgi:exoribonuclease R